MVALEQPSRFDRVGPARLVVLAFLTAGVFHVYWFMKRAREVRRADPAHGRAVTEAGWMAAVWTVIAFGALLNAWDPEHWLDPTKLLLPMLAAALITVLTSFSLRDYLRSRGEVVSWLYTLVFNAFYLETRFAKLEDAAPSVQAVGQQRAIIACGLALVVLQVAFHGRKLPAHIQAGGLCDQAMELMAAKKLPEAERLLRQAIALDPDDGMPPAALALVLDGDGRQSEAVVSARAALAVYERRAQNGDEDNPDRASLMRSVAYYLIGKAEAAAARDAKANISERAAAAGRARDALTRSMSIRPNGKARELLDSLSARPAP